MPRFAAPLGLTGASGRVVLSPLLPPSLRSQLPCLLVMRSRDGVSLGLVAKNCCLWHPLLLHTWLLDIRSAVSLK